MSAMANTSHAMTHAARGMHGMEPRMGRPKARAVTATSCPSHSRTVPTMPISSAFPMNAVALAMNSLGVLRVHLCLARSVSLADELAQV
jgi:hypothetical protein